MRYLIFIMVAIGLVSCESNKTSESASNEAVVQEGPLKLKDQLDAKRTAWEQNAHPERRRVYEEGIQSINDSGIIQKAMNVGDTAPNFTLHNALDHPITLSEELKKGPVVLTWYRGGWCPYCNLTLHAMQEKIAEFKEQGAVLIALTPELPDKSLTTKEKHNLEFEVLSDLKNHVGHTYGVVFSLTPQVAEIYQQNHNLVEHNGHDEFELPLAATYIIDQNGVIRYAFLDADYRKRAEPAELIEELKKLNSSN